MPVMGFPGGSDGEESASSMGDLGSAPGSGRAPGEGKGCPPLPMPFTLVSPRAFPKFLLFPALSCVRLLVTSGCSPPGFSVHGVFQSKILEWVAIFTSKESSPPRDQTQVSHVFCIAGRFFTTELPGKPGSLLCSTVNQPYVYICPLPLETLFYNNFTWSIM